MRIDFHTHSHYSHDSWNSIPALLRKASSMALGAIALTDHGTMEGCQKASEYSLRHKMGIEVIPGCEFLTDRGELMGLFLTEMIRAKEFGEVCDQIHEQGGFAIIPHPFDPLRGSACNPEKLPPALLRQVDGIEVFNARCSLRSSNQKALAFAEGRFPITTAGSDAHFPFEVGRAWGEIPDGVGIDIAMRKGLIAPMGKYSSPAVHGLTTTLKLARKAGIFKPRH